MTTPRQSALLWIEVLIRLVLLVWLVWHGTRLMQVEKRIRDLQRLHLYHVPHGPVDKVRDVSATPVCPDMGHPKGVLLATYEVKP